MPTSWFGLAVTDLKGKIYAIGYLGKNTQNFTCLGIMEEYMP